MHRRTTNPRSTAIWVLLLVGFGAMEFPGVLFFANKSEPEILGLPFIYGHMLLWWAYMCVVLLYAYRVHWGQPEHVEGAEQ